MITTILSFVLVLGILIFFHELGHFLLARIFGVGVETFSLGYGNRLFGKKIGRTDYRISMIPIGGFVKMVGEEPDSEIDPEDIPVSFTHQHVFKRICIVAAGPLFNILLAMILFFGLFLVSGVIVYTATVGEVTKESPAENAGMLTGDRILTIGDQTIGSWDEMTQAISENGDKALGITLLREGETVHVTVVPKRVAQKNIFGEEIDRYMIGIGISDDFFTKKLSPAEAFFISINRTVYITELTVLSIVKLIQGTVSVKTLGGPIMIAEMAGQHAREGMGNLIIFIGLISINLAVLNLLPIPVLDGGHLLFFLIELIIRRPVSMKVREIAQQAGMLILLMLMIFVIYNDITRVFFN